MPERDHPTVTGYATPPGTSVWTIAPPQPANKSRAFLIAVPRVDGVGFSGGREQPRLPPATCSGGHRGYGRSKGNAGAPSPRVARQPLPSLAIPVAPSSPSVAGFMAFAMHAVVLRVFSIGGHGAGLSVA